MGGHAKRHPITNQEPKTEEELVQEACDVKLDSSVYTQSDRQSTSTGRPRFSDLEYNAPGSKALLSGTTTGMINKIIDSQEGDETFGAKENVTIPKYSGTDDIVKDFT